MSIIYQGQIIDTMNPKYAGIEKKLVHFDVVWEDCEHVCFDECGPQCELDENCNPCCDYSCMSCFCPPCYETEIEDHVIVYREVKYE